MIVFVPALLAPSYDDFPIYMSSVRHFSGVDHQWSTGAGGGVQHGCD
jgi:hypothetical protein